MTTAAVGWLLCGLIVAALGVVAAVRSRRRVRTAATEREAAAEALIRARTGVLLVDDRERIVWAIGASPVTSEATVVGRPSADVFSSWPGVVSRIRHALNGIPSQDVVSVGGEHVAVTCSPFVGPDGRTLVGLTIADVGLNSVVVRRLEEAGRSKDRLVASVSHELRTPLTGILGFAETSLLAVEVADRDLLREGLETILLQAREMADIIEDLLVASRMEAGTVTVTATIVDLATEAHRVLDHLDGRLGRVVGVEGAAAVAVADPLRVRQIIRNLLTNALRYGGETVEIVTGADPAGVWVEVRDSGPEIPAETRKRMFAAFEGSAPPGVTGSIGLGLHISRRLAEQMGGSLVYRHDGERSVFRLRLRGTSPRRAEDRRPLDGVASSP